MLPHPFPKLSGAVGGRERVLGSLGTAKAKGNGDQKGC